MATIKEIIDNFCFRVNIPAPTSYAGSTEPAARQYLSLFQFIGDNLRNRPYQWPQLKRPYYFNTQTDVRRYQLPGDFYRILDSSEWDVTNKWPMRGPISDYQFAFRQFAVVSLQIRKAFRLIGPTNYLYSTAPYAQRSAGTIEIDPPGANNTDQLFLGYISCNWIQPLDWTAGEVVIAGQIRTGDGFVYRTAAGGTCGATRPDWTSGTDTDGSVLWTVYTEPYLASAQNSNLTDLDQCLFDQDTMVEGMRWAYFRAKKQDYMQERTDWENNLKSAFARFNGPTRINMSDEFGDYEDWPNTPAGSWNV